MPVRQVLLPSEPSLWLPPTYSWNPSKKHFYAVSRMGKKGTCSLLADCWTRLTQVKWIILSQLQLSDSVNPRLNALEETSSNRQTERGQTFLNDALSISLLNYAHLNKILDSSNYWNWRFHPDTVLYWDIAQLAYWVSWPELHSYTGMRPVLLWTVLALSCSTNRSQEECRKFNSPVSLQLIR